MVEEKNRIRMQATIIYRSGRKGKSWKGIGPPSPFHCPRTLEGSQPAKFPTIVLTF
jgi:hypothetical protein